jgi:high-affinity K+ transport system ATPase subunit B
MTTAHPHHRRPLFDPAIVRWALWDAIIKLDPRTQVRNPVMFTVLVGSVATTLLFFERLAAVTGESPWFVAGVSLWLWFTVLFANFAEAMAEGRGKAQAAELKSTRQNVIAKKLIEDVGTPKIPLDFQHLVRQAKRRLCPPRICGRAISSSSKPAIKSPAMAKSSRVWPASMKAPSPAKARP